MITKKLKRFLFRHGYLPIGDAHETIVRVRNRIDEMNERLAKQYQLTIPTSEQNIDERIRAFRTERADSFFKLLGEETDSQWDRIMDRRAAAWFYVAFGLLVGFILAKL